MKLIKLAAVALNQTPLDWPGNVERIRSAIGAARRAEASVICLPELCITGYGCEDAFHSPGVLEMAQRVLGELLPDTAELVVSLGLPWMHAGGLYNAACLVVDGKLQGFVGKQHLAGDGIHYEPRWFKPWPAERVHTTEFAGEEYPIGDIAFDVGGVRLGFEICEDAWVGRRPGATLAQRGVDILLNPSASHFAFGKQDIRRRFVLEGSRAFGVSYVYANLLGNESGRAIYDGGTMIASSGGMLAEGRRFSFADFQITTAVVDVNVTRMNRAKLDSFVPDTETEPGEVVRTRFAFPSAAPAPRVVQPANWEQGQAIKQEEFTRAVSLGLWDYLRKSRSRGYVVSLSGGADSAAVATLSALALRQAVDQLGPAGALEQLEYFRGALTTELRSIRRDTDVADAATFVRELVGELLICVYQATANSSETTHNAARDVAAAVGAEFLRLDVDPLVRGYIEIIEQGIGRQLTWERDDVALQNIQARVRSPSVWMLANLRGALLLATSNRSEAAVGYATMDGDTSGGLSPIAGIDKAFLRNWLRWMETDGPEGLGPLPALAAVNAQQPTAELRPPSAGQTDEADLMPYDVLDAIERIAIRDKQAPLAAYQLMRAQFSEVDPRQMAEWVDRFYRLWCRNQWKRERYAPSFHLDDKNLDPKTWCRFPILSGGFERELDELRVYVDRETE